MLTADTSGKASKARDVHEWDVKEHSAFKILK